MKKLAGMTALLLTAGSAFAGDFDAAQNAGFDSTKGPATLIALVLTLIGAGVWWMWKNRTKLPLTISVIVIATMLSLHAGDFANAADSGYGPSNNMWNRFGSWFGSFWTSHFEWENLAPFNGGAHFTPVPSVPPKDDGRAGSGNGASPPRQQN